MNDYSDWTTTELEIELAQLEEQKWDLEEQLGQIYEELDNRMEDE